MCYVTLCYDLTSAVGTVGNADVSLLFWSKHLQGHFVVTSLTGIWEMIEY